MGVLVLILLLTVRSGKAPTVPTHTATRSVLACKGYLLRCIRRCSTPFIVLAVWFESMLASFGWELVN